MHFCLHCDFTGSSFLRSFRLIVSGYRPEDESSVDSKRSRNKQQCLIWVENKFFRCFPSFIPELFHFFAHNLPTKTLGGWFYTHSRGLVVRSQSSYHTVGFVQKLKFYCKRSQILVLVYSQLSCFLSVTPQPANAHSCFTFTL